jgi:hypothetical protein
MPPDWVLLNCRRSSLVSLTPSACRVAASSAFRIGGGAALGFALQAPHRVDRLALIHSACLDGAIPGGGLSWFLVHVPELNLIGWWLLKSAFGALDVITGDAAPARLGYADAG